MSSMQDALYVKRLRERKAEEAARVEAMPKPWWCEGGHGCVWTKPYRVEQSKDDAGNVSTYLYCRRHTA